MSLFPINVVDLDTGTVHALMGVATACGKPCGDWPVALGGTWDCPECEAIFDAAWAAQDAEVGP